MVETAAHRYGTPLALPLMDLRLEKRDLLHLLGNGEADADTLHFQEPPPEDMLGQLQAFLSAPFASRNQAVRPFSLMTKLITDPITAIAMAGTGVEPHEDAGVMTVHRCLSLAEAVISRSLQAT